MALTFYVIDENGQYSSQDGKIKYRKLEGSEIYYYLRSDNGKGKRFYIEEDIGIEIAKGKENIVRKFERRKQYIADIAEEHPYEVISFFAKVDGFDIDGEEVAKDEDTDVLKQALYNLVVEDLYKGIDKLDVIEKHIIESLYLKIPPKRQCDIAKELGVSQPVISKKLSSAKKKLKKFLKKWL